MSTSLKIQHADEILEAMAEALGEKMTKKAAGPVLEAYKEALNSVQDENELKLVWNKFMDGLNQEESVDEALKLQAAKARELNLPGYATPAMSNDAQMKEAAGPALEEYKAALSSVQDENQLKLVWNKFMDALNQEESVNEALKLQAAKARELNLPGYATPAMSNDKMADEECEKCELCGQKVVKEQDPDAMPVVPGEDKPEPMAWDGQTLAAAKFAMKHLVKVADALDGKGFKEVADLVDEAVNKLASKKSR